MKKTPFNKAAFTLVETLVSLFVLSIALTGSFAMITFSLNNAMFIKNSFVASGLTQEGMEIVRNLRDSDWLAERTFGFFGGGQVVQDGVTYCVQYDDARLRGPCLDPRLFLDSSKFYVHDSASGNPSVFSRTIKFSAISDKSIVATVEVSWKDRSGIKKINAEEHFYNWY